MCVTIFTSAREVMLSVALVSVWVCQFVCLQLTTKPPDFHENEIFCKSGCSVKEEPNKCWWSGNRARSKRQRTTTYFALTCEKWINLVSDQTFVRIIKSRANSNRPQATCNACRRWHCSCSQVSIYGIRDLESGGRGCRSPWLVSVKNILWLHHAENHCSSQ